MSSAGYTWMLPLDEDCPVQFKADRALASWA